MLPGKVGTFRRITPKETASIIKMTILRYISSVITDTYAISSFNWVSQARQLLFYPKYSLNYEPEYIDNQRLACDSGSAG